MERRLKRVLIGLALTALPLTAMAVPAPTPATVPQRYGVFDAPLVPFGKPTATQRHALDAAIAAYAAEGDAAHIEPLRAYLAHTPRSPWRAALLLNMGLARQHAGAYSDALALLGQARAAASGGATRSERAVGIRALGALLDLQTRIGDAEALKSLLHGFKRSPETAAISEIVTDARAGLWQIEHNPQQTLRCGIVALEALLPSHDPASHGMQILASAKAGRRGTSLARLMRLSRQAGIPAVAVRRGEGQPIPVPSVVHWRVGHYAAILAEVNGRYRVRDPAMGSDTWVTASVLQHESSAYFLVPKSRSGSMPWHALAHSEATGIIGGGATSSSDNTRTGPCDKTVGGPSSCECNQPSTSGAGGTAGGSITGMPAYRVHAMLVSLNINDTPVGYTPPVGPPVNLRVTYSQREAHQPDTFTFFNVGHKWTLNWRSYIQDDPTAAGSRVMIYLRGGGERMYSGYNAGTGAFSHEEDGGAELVRVSASPVRYERRMPDGSKSIYAESDGSTYYPRRIFLTQLIDATGNAVTLHYDARHRLTDITDALGQVTTFAYEDANDPLHLTGVTDPFGRSATLAYDTSGRLDSITDAIGMTSNFTYDSGTFITSMTTPYGTTQFTYGESGMRRWLEITDPNGENERVEFRHAAPGIAFTDSPVPSGMNLLNSYISYRNTFYWDKEAMKRAPGDYAQARILHWFHLRTNTSTTSGVLESIKNPLERRVWYNYPGEDWAGANGTLEKPSKIGRVLPDGRTQLTRKSYNPFGNVTKVIDPAGRELDMAYADNGMDLLVIKRKTSSGYDTLATFTYNDQHEPLTYTDADGNTTTYTYNDVGQRTTLTNAINQTTRYTYNASGQLTDIVDPNGVATAHYTYDAIGRIATFTNAAGYTLAYTYDALDRLIRTTYPDGTHEDVTWDKLDRTTETDRYGDVTRYAHDAVRNLLSKTDPSGHLTRYGYFANGQLESVTDGVDHTTRIDRDIERRKTAETRANGTKTTYAYDVVGRLTRSTDALGGTTGYAYGIDDRLDTVTDPNGNTTRYHYDPDTGKLIQRDSPDTGTTTYTYDPAGHLITQTDAKGQTKTYSYDAIGRLTRTVYADGQTVTYGYDAGRNGIGRLTSLTDPDGSTEYEYNAAGHLVTRTRTATDGTRLILSYAYNTAGLPTHMVYPSGAVVRYHYEHDRLTGISLNGHHLDRHRLSLLGDHDRFSEPDHGRRGDFGRHDQPLLSNIAYAAFGPVSGWIWGNGLKSQRRFDNAGRLASYTVANATRSLTYDTVDNITAITGSDLNQTFGYDGLNRLTAANADDFDLGYTYDANGNRTAARDGNTTAAYTIDSTSNRLMAVGSTDYQYDANGNVTSDGRHTYGFNARNRLTTVDGGNTAAYAYNGIGQRIDKKVTQSYTLTADLNGDGKITPADLHVLQGYILHHQSPPKADLNHDGRVDGHDTSCIADRIGHKHHEERKWTFFGWWGHRRPCHVGETVHKTTETRFVYDGPNLLGEYAADGKARQEIIWMGGAPVALLQDGDVYYVDSDQLGAPRTLTDQHRHVVWRWEGRPFGDSQPASTFSHEHPNIAYYLRFPGQYYDAETGLNYNYNRDYNPIDGRYIESDPIGIIGGLNTYTYVLGNPISWIDPTGLDATDWWNTSGGRNPATNGPTNGNWGGKCWSGGANSCGGNPMGKASPTDSGDQCYQRHDNCYAGCGANAQCVAACDKHLVKELKKLPDNSKKWPNPPRPGTEGDSERYRWAAIQWFSK